MRKATCLTALLALFCGLLLVTGCGGETAEASEFAEGAFPPMLSDIDYHRRSWTRTDCLTCHEDGIDGAPKVEHRSGLVPHLKQVKCRTCHVFVAGYEPPKK